MNLVYFKISIFCCLSVVHTSLPHLLWGQYSWSISIGIRTPCITRSSNRTSSTIPVFEVGHVLIRTPLCVLRNVQFVTETWETGFSPFRFPKLPILIPCPGPQITLWILTLRLPCPMEMQSSPVLMVESTILIPLHRPMWIPSVLGLSPGASTVNCLNVKFSQPRRLTWKLLLFRVLMSLTKLFLTKLNLILCEICKT